MTKTKSKKRGQLIIDLDTHKKLKAQAAREGKSLFKLINEWLAEREAKTKDSKSE